ncbi:MULTISPECIES: Na(+)/H(+) antiporter subunit F1 [unclassified Geobacillus]|uniref:Multiple resistance and pH regulation protein F n=1 Tax=Geobacillus sp. (strain WCH70) TaxID=471223 RepID=C5D711_GEOSW|nr:MULTISPECIES: Na(+)/H(+) antiporter subunit F1 [unclassified Geobacillus]PDM39065.1 Na(+)/H(+) antiporter subunit F [Parageobacillus yumthangensis]RDV21903.1 Na(+)/H(+) antiporter subunit F1 [Parageobacillus toebii]TXK89119.1 Na(+)/H(+) antiporter subunit F1 [Parageobacillus sp. SY1]PUF87639.1 Na(+)/H(+) antiporter subunit F1 [Geobacillus sp. LYN3]TXK88159.1 Na(+)/H(+) antiporter subunit F1 [Geobacillus sp. AYS3]
MTVIFNIALVILSIAMFCFLYRVVKGPSVADRVIALDAMGICLAGIVAIFSIILETSAFLEVILLIGILAFLGTVAFAKFLQKGVVIERERDR